MIVDFTLNGTTGSQINLTAENTNESAYSFLGLVVGRDSTSSDIGSGNFNYLYFDNTDGTNPGATPLVRTELLCRDSRQWKTERVCHLGYQYQCRDGRSPMGQLQRVDANHRNICPK